MSTLEESGLRGRIRETRPGRLAFPATERGRKRRRIALLAVPFFALATFGAFIPLVKMFRISVSEQFLYEVQGWTLEPYRQLFASIAAFVPVVGTDLSAAIAVGGEAVNPVYGRTIWNSLWFGAVTTVASVALGIAIAHGLEKYDLPRKDMLITLISFPISLPGIVAAFMMIVLFGQTGFLTNVFAVITGAEPVDIQLTGQPSGTTLAVVGLFFGYIYSMIPRATLLLRGTYAEVNTDAEEAARSLGATPLQTFRYVTLPQIRPGIVGALILTFRTALAIFGTVLVLKSLSVVTFRFDQLVGVGYELNIASALASVFFVFTVLFTFLGLRYTSAEVGR
ncbi:ABC-type spermidine/putrescine transport system,permease component [Halorhabdus sp. SVX81]|uniref:ABC transporter permease n=1 Tax=Halorhabdus sp. SVX81 TaxID=2978283 RepID=UPI0023D9AA83|nr:ABC transporter permease subunit [Halorhabdus sp. SVX81]WEL17644.1 ABC-type spermidine/putrescine transport system,permease component [Halorhabdus sp. SVX81]